MKGEEPEFFQHYRILRRPDTGMLWELGRGAMGVTYKAIDTRLHVTVALKIINEHLFLEESMRERFLREARAAASLRHRNVASVYHLGENGRNYFYAMEFIEGETLDSLVRRSGPLALINALAVVLQVSRALMSAHSKNLVHRDIKPANIMLVDEVDETAVVKLIDFGLAKSVADEGASLVNTNTAGFLGTPLYASPEQCDERTPDIRSDIYSLGITLWYLLTGAPPFTGSLGKVFAQHLHRPPPFEKLPLEVPPPAHALLGRMLAKDPAHRPGNPAVLRREIEECMREVLACLPAPLVSLGTTIASDVPASVMPEVPVAPLPSASTGVPAQEIFPASVIAEDTAPFVVEGKEGTTSVCAGMDITLSPTFDSAASPSEAIAKALVPTHLPPPESPASAEDKPIPVTVPEWEFPLAEPKEVPEAVDGAELAPDLLDQPTFYTPETGALLGRHYRLHRLIGEDETARLFLAQSTHLPQEWGVARVFHPEIAELAPEGYLELEIAYERLRAAPHKNLLELRDLEVTGPHRFLVTSSSGSDFSLLDLLRHRGSLTFPEAIALARHTAEGVDHLCTHVGGTLDLSLRAVWIRPDGHAPHPSEPGGELDRWLLDEPADSWPDSSLKLDPFQTLLPVRWREGGAATTWAGRRSQLRELRTVTAAAHRCSPLRALALLVYELLSGAPPSSQPEHAARHAYYPPLPRLSEEANRLLQHALTDRFTSIGVTHFCEDLVAAQGRGPRMEHPSTARGKLPLSDNGPHDSNYPAETGPSTDTPGATAPAPERLERREQTDTLSASQAAAPELLCDAEPEADVPDAPIPRVEFPPSMPVSTEIINVPNREFLPVESLLSVPEHPRPVAEGHPRRFRGSMAALAVVVLLLGSLGTKALFRSHGSASPREMPAKHVAAASLPSGVSGFPAFDAAPAATSPVAVPVSGGYHTDQAGNLPPHVPSAATPVPDSNAATRPAVETAAASATPPPLVSSAAEAFATVNTMPMPSASPSPPSATPPADTSFASAGMRPDSTYWPTPSVPLPTPAKRLAAEPAYPKPRPSPTPRPPKRQRTESETTVAPEQPRSSAPVRPNSTPSKPSNRVQDPDVNTFSGGAPGG